MSVSGLIDKHVNLPCFASVVTSILATSGCISDLDCESVIVGRRSPKQRAERPSDQHGLIGPAETLKSTSNNDKKVRERLPRFQSACWELHCNDISRAK